MSRYRSIRLTTHAHAQLEAFRDLAKQTVEGMFDSSLPDPAWWIDASIGQLVEYLALLGQAEMLRRQKVSVHSRRKAKTTDLEPLLPFKDNQRTTPRR